MLRALTVVLGSMVLGLGLGAASPASARDATEPPPPRAAPRTSIMAEELPRAGGIIVFGADRPLGFEIAKALAAAGKQVSAVVPPDADRAALQALKITVLATDLLEPEALKTAFAAAPLRAVVAPYNAESEGSALGLDGTRNIIEATKDAGVPRFVLVSPTGAGDSVATLPWYVRILRGDVADVEAVEDETRQSGLDFTIVRAGWILEDAEPQGGVTLDEGGQAFSWIAAGDLAHLVAGIIDAKSLEGRTTTAVDPARASLLSLLF